MECLWLIFGFAIVIITYGLFISLVTISISTFSALKRPFRNTLLGAPRSSIPTSVLSIVPRRVPTLALNNYWSNRTSLIHRGVHHYDVFRKTSHSSFELETGWNQFGSSEIFLWFLLFRFGESVFSKIQVFHLLLDRYQRLGWTRYFHQAVFCLSCLFFVLCKIEHKL